MTYIPEFLEETSWRSATPHEIRHSKIQFGRSLDYYRKRIEAIGFTKMNSVVDVACGCGQWTIPLDEYNGLVTGFDYSMGLLEVAGKAADYFHRSHIEFMRGDFHAIPFQSNSVDAVICYSAIYIAANEPIVVSEMCRILKPGGRLYLVSDGAGWPFYNLWERGMKQRRIRSVLHAIKLWIRGVFWQRALGQYGRYYSFLTQPEVRHLMRANGMAIEFFGADGEYGNPDGKLFQPLYGKRYFGLPSDFELLARKRVT